MAERTDHKLKEAFRWAPDEYIRYIRQTVAGSVYKVKAIHVTKTLNDVRFTEEELALAGRSLAYRPLTLNHASELAFPDNRVLDAEFEDAAVEGLILVADPCLIELIESKKITAVSIEAQYRWVDLICDPAECEWQPHGIAFTGLGLLTPGVAPGDPLASIVLKKNAGITAPPQQGALSFVLGRASQGADTNPTRKGGVLMESKNEAAPPLEPAKTTTPPWEQEQAPTTPGEARAVQAEQPQLKMESMEVKRKMQELDFEEGKETGSIQGKAIAAPEPGIMDERRIIRESISKKLRGGRLFEQWTVPTALVAAPAARLRNFIIISEETIDGKAGDVVNIPYVKDFDLDVLASVGAVLTEKTGLVASAATVLKESAAFTKIAYSDLEKMTPDILARLEEVAVQAAFRSEDKAILDDIIADTGLPADDHIADSPANFKAAYISQALGTLMSQGKDVNFGDCVLVLNASMYDMLVRDIAGTQSLAFAKPDTIRDGLVRQLMGVNVVISNYLPTSGSPAKKSAFLVHKNSYVLAPKRELLVETQPETENRKVKLTASHTFGIKLLDNKDIVNIKTAFT